MPCLFVCFTRFVLDCESNWLQWLYGQNDEFLNEKTQIISEQVHKYQQNANKHRYIFLLYCQSYFLLINFSSECFKQALPHLPVLGKCL